MFDFFSSKNKCLGIDIGTTGVKVVELKKEGNAPILSNYAFSYDSGSLLQSGGLEVLDGQTGDILVNVLKKGNFSTKRAVLGIPGFLALISFMELPEMPQNEIDQAVRFEANKYIPTPIEEVSLGWEIVGSFKEKPVEGGLTTRHNQKMQIMVVTVPKNSIEKVSAIAQRAKVKMAAMEVENFAAVRCLVGNDKGTLMVANIGAKATDFTIVSDGVVRVTRSVDIGGVEITRSIASGMGIDLQRADKLKKSGRINLMDPKDRLSGLVSPVMGMVTDEARRLRDIFYKKNPLKKIERVILTGGTSKLATIAEYLSAQLSVECRIGNALARVGVEKKNQQAAEQAAPELAVAIGLALRGLEGN